MDDLLLSVAKKYPPISSNDTCVFRGVERKFCEDGRVLSSQSERWILEDIKKEIGELFVISPIRYWHDFQYNGVYNLKISDCTSADNISSGQGFFWFLTGGKISNEKFGLKDKRTITWLKENITLDTDIDYYFLIINKINIDNSYITSFSRLSNVVSNTSNPPFQAKWDNNKTLSNRTRKEQYIYLLTKYKNSLTVQENKNIIEKIIEEL